MTWVRLKIAGAALAAMTGPLAAFEEQRTAPVPVPTVPPAATPAPPSGSGLGLTPDAAAPKEPAGKEIYIPGWGKRILPKLDFGLDLLYGPNGGNEPKRPEDERSDTPDGIGVRGKLKF
ncbi:MAG: hypothetical protein ACREC6_08045 [Hyphomicrobiaceae bacterium]